MENDALKNEFLVESFENLSTINEDLTHLEKDPTDKELLNKIYRTVHTLKGSASFLGYKKLQEITHAGESLLDELREGKLSADAEIVDTLLGTFDICNLLLKNIESDNEEGDVDMQENQRRLESFLEGQQSVSSSAKTNPEEVVEEESLEHEDDDVDTLVEAHKSKAPVSGEPELSAAALASLEELVAEGKIDSSVFDELAAKPEPADEINSAAMDSLRELISEGKISESALDEVNKVEVDNTEQKVEPTEVEVIFKEEAPVVSETVAPDEAKKSISDSFVRVNVNVLDKIMNVVGELVLNRNQILQFASQNDSREFNRLSQQLNVITSELQSEVMATRMQPIGNTLNKFERLVRDIARSNEKKINLKLVGQETELDKSLIESIKDPLVHIIRNSCDHGVESPGERTEAGKSEQGNILLKAYNESGQVTIEISDDGRGLDPLKISNKAIEKGLLTQEKIDTMSEVQILNLIFRPGFSTAEKVTNISGRGVGMDVVKTNIEKIGGSVSVSSVVGNGTTFKLRIPLTLAIVPSLMIKSNEECFAIPQLNLVELVRLETKEDMTSIEEFSGSEFLRLRGKLTPIFRLDKELNLKEVNEKSELLKNTLEDSVTKKLKSEKILDEALNIVILNAEDNVYGIIVDEIMDTEEIVVKPLNNALKKINLFGGATIMGDGRVALILDALGFLSEVSQNTIEKSEVDNQDDETVAGSATEYQENLLFKLFDNRVYAMPLTLVSRLEDIQVDKIEKTGHQKIIRYLDAPMPLVSIEKILRLEGTNLLESYQEENANSLNCIVTKIQGRNFGIVVKEVMDISIDNIDIDDSGLNRDGIMGTVFIEGKTVPLLDFYTILAKLNLGLTKKTPLSIEQKSKKILLVDDSPMYRKLEADSLREAGFQVETANHGEEGFLKLQSGNYDLLITDIEMPLLNGFEFAKKVRESLPENNIPILALSTRFSDADRERGKNCGFNYHLEKFKKEEVLDLVSQILKENSYGNSTAS